VACNEKVSGGVVLKTIYMSKLVKQIRKQFKKVRDANHKFEKEKAKLNDMSNAHWGFDYTKLDDDDIDNTLDFDCPTICSKSFIDRMDHHQINKGKK
jgi:hypothetical protein